MAFCFSMKIKQLLALPRPLIMGVLNVTPDSFSDGGKFNSLDKAIAHAKEMEQQGADIIDIGGESTRPGSKPVSENEEIQRVIPIIKALQHHISIPISIDTSKAIVMQQAVKAGAAMINDIYALQNSNALEIASELQVPVCLMHMQKIPETMQKAPAYQDILLEIKNFFQKRIEICSQYNIYDIILDPGIGFGKTLEHNLLLLNNINAFLDFNLPLLIGASRKTMIGALLNNTPVEERLYGSLSAHIIAAWQGTKIIRTHDVKASYEGLTVMQAIKTSNK